MKKLSRACLGMLLAAVAVPQAAYAQDAEEDTDGITITGGATVVSDYRFRGFSQSNEEAAIQGTFTITHESGLYVGTWASNLSGWGTFGGSNTELDIYGGFSFPVGGANVDVGLTWYMYPGGANDTDFAEPYIKLSGTAGPVSLLAGVAYAPKQEALGNFSNTPQSRGQKQDNLYLWGDASAGIPSTDLTVKAHIGYSDGNPGLGPNGTSIAPTGKYWDWMVGADYALGPVTVGVAYVDTDISRSDSAYLGGGFASSKNGSSIASGRIVFSLGASF